MKGEKSKLSYILSIMLLGGVLVFSGCSENNNVYNPDRIQEEAKADFPVKDIDPNQTWETSAVCSASVSVNEKSGDAYAIKVYTANPYNIHDDATLLGQTTVIDGRTVDFKFDMPAALQYVYVMKVNGKGYSSVVPVAVENKMMKMTFGETSGTTRMAATRNAVTRGPENAWEPDVPSSNNKDIFPTEAPAGSIKYTGEYNIIAGGNYIIDGNTKKINCDNGANFYIKGQVSLSEFYTGHGQSKIILLPGATLTMNKFELSSQTILSVGKDATFICKGDFNVSNQFLSIYNAGTIDVKGGYLDSRYNQAAFYNLGTFNFTNANITGIHFYNGGTINATKIDNNNQTYFINGVDGKIILTGKFSCENYQSTAENEGEIQAASFGVAGSSAFYNSSTGKVTISGQSDIDSNASIWDNQGYFKTRNMTFKAGSPCWFNRCQLYVDEKLTYTVSNSDDGLIMDAGSYAECHTFYGDQACIKMGSKSFFNVLGEAKFKHNPKGFIATGDDYALLKMGSAVQEHLNQGFSITYQGKLYVACDNHFKQGNDGAVNHPLISIVGDAQITGADHADITIEKSECNPGYNSTPGGGSEDKVQTYAYAFEDMAKGVGDYDFNDVVLYVSVPYNKDGKRVIDVTLKAAGASKQLAVLFNNKIIFGNVHEALGVSTGTLVNTGGAKGTEKTVTIEVKNDFSLTTNGDFCISDGKTTIHIPNFTNGFKKGDIPYALRIANATWKWPKETINIVEAYNGFEEWAQNASAEPTWYNDYTSDKVMN